MIVRQVIVSGTKEARYYEDYLTIRLGAKGFELLSGSKNWASKKTRVKRVFCLCK